MVVCIKLQTLIVFLGVTLGFVFFVGGLNLKKHTIDCDNALWRDVKIFKESNDLKCLNDAVVVLLRRGLSKND